ncbi:MAG: hypothetical protein WC584_04695 [Candidatus Pacearchaeota archaeon]
MLAPLDVSCAKEELDKITRCVLNLEKKLFSREQVLFSKGKSFEQDIQYKILYNSTISLYKELNYWLNILGEFKEY